MPPRPQREPTDVDFTVVADPAALPGPTPRLPWYEHVMRWMERTGPRFGPVWLLQLLYLPLMFALLIIVTLVGIVVDKLLHH